MFYKMVGKLIIFSAPSGAGKTTIVRHLLSKYNDKLAFSISACTRQPRENEVHGKDYYFITQEDFLHRIAQKEFVEFEEVYSGTYYGTLRSEIERIWAENKAVVFDIDVIGGLHLKDKFKDQALAIFVQPPSLEVLSKRLYGRGTDTIDKLNERIGKAKKELEYANQFDVILENDDLTEACIKAEQLIDSFLSGHNSSI